MQVCIHNFIAYSIINALRHLLTVEPRFWTLFWEISHFAVFTNLHFADENYGKIGKNIIGDTSLNIRLMCVDSSISMSKREQRFLDQGISIIRHKNLKGIDFVRRINTIHPCTAHVPKGVTFSILYFRFVILYRILGRLTWGYKAQWYLLLGSSLSSRRR